MSVTRAPHAQHLRFLIGICLALALVACSPRPVAVRGVAAPDSTIVEIFVATERTFSNLGPTFGAPRNKGLRYFRADVSVPPTHQTGQIEWSGETPDGATDFVVTGTQAYGTGQAFETAVKAAQHEGEILLFVPGYNNTLSDALYRLAQMQVDFVSDNTGVLYSWPSAGDPRGYVYDRDSVLFARDDLEQLMRQLTSHSDDRIAILAHSMGSQLVMEAMRQLALKGDRQVLSRINSVVLMSPDIDPDVFRSQAEAIGTLPQPFLIFVSQDDRALSLSGLLTGRKPRLGVIDNPQTVEGLGVKVIDFTGLANGEGLNHSVPTTSPAAIAVLNGIIGQVESGQDGFQDYMVLSTPQ